MGIFNVGRQFSSINNIGRTILYVYSNGRLIWSKNTISDVFSCFYNGYWIDEYPWTDEQPWTD